MANSAIKVSTYRNIVEQLTNAQRQIADVSTYYYNAAYEIVRLEEFDPTIDLISPLYNAYLSSVTVYANTPQAVVEAVKRLQGHVLSKARTDANIDATDTSNRFDSIDDWIDAAGTNGVGTNVGRHEDIDTSFTVSTEFASLSAQAGYAIDSDNIA